MINYSDAALNFLFFVLGLYVGYNLSRYVFTELEGRKINNE